MRLGQRNPKKVIYVTECTCPQVRMPRKLYDAVIAKLDRQGASFNAVARRLFTEWVKEDESTNRSRSPQS